MGTRETALWPAIGSAIGVEESVLLLETEPGDRVLGLLHDLGGMVAVVGPVGGAVVVVGLGKDEDVVTSAEGILEDGRGTEVDIGVMAGSLVGGRTIKVPDAELADVRHLLADGLEEGSGRRSGEEENGIYCGLGAKTTVAIDPDI